MVDIAAGIGPRSVGLDVRRSRSAIRIDVKTVASTAEFERVASAGHIAASVCSLLGWKSISTVALLAPF